MTKKDARSSIRASIETTSSSILGSGENSRVNLEASCVRSLQRYGDSIKKLESLKNQNMESSLKLQKMQNIIQKFSDKITQV
ncbi:hypothetical protein ChUKH1_07545 [Cryptosporidium hominis]|nr:hypothetical protein ChTU502y2012_405g0720 [Cryptosporidium hominis]PPA64532.1 hypothetical protein ChUKH1_07545 [Cryptosporidium hominis]